MTTSRAVRPIVTSYSPSLWTHTFSSFSFDHQVQESYEEAIEALKKEVKSMLTAATSDKLIILIDTLERLALAYHFETEIEQKLQHVYNFLGDEDEHLFLVALRFRLLRQHQYHVSCSVFEKFTDDKNKFNESLCNDVEGLLSLYEAAHIRIQGEDILEEGLTFATNHLTRMLPHLESSLQDKVKAALEQPLHKGIQIVQSRYYIPIYERQNSKDELLVRFAKLNFNFLQNLYKKELSQLSRWWNKFEFQSKLPFVRDRLIEYYFWGMAFHYEPHYSYVRTATAISMQMQTIMDDSYDNYASLEEAKLYTQILEGGKMDEIDVLPEYIKIGYQFITSVYEDYERHASEREKVFLVPYFKESVIQFGRAYYREAEWLTEGGVPSSDECRSHFVITSGVYVIFIALFPGITSVTKETVDWLLSEPKLLVCTGRMGRLLNDSVSHERESRGGDMSTMRDCHTEHRDLSEEETIANLIKQIDDGWKDFNKEWVLAKSSGVPKEVLQLLLNYTRAAQVTYKNGDGFTNPENILAPHIIALLGDPIVI